MSWLGDKYLQLVSALALALLVSPAALAQDTTQKAAAESAVRDLAFEVLADRFEGFRLIVNTPPVPDTRFLDGERRPASLKDFAGKALLVNFWATWCTPCIREMPGLNALNRELGGETFQVVAIASGQQVGKTPRDFLRQHQLDALDVYTDPHASLMALFETETLPTTLLVDRAGRIRGGIIGEADWISAEARALIAHLMDAR